MPREPFQGSDWGERTPGTTSGAGPGRGRRLAGEAAALQLASGAIVKPVKKMHTAQRKRIKAALDAPFVLGIPRETLDAIADCESGGNPRAKSSDGLYRGKYQFHRGTWASMGGTGDPARASEIEQDRRAAMLIKRSGSSPWPACG